MLTLFSPVVLFILFMIFIKKITKTEIKMSKIIELIKTLKKQDLDQEIKENKKLAYDLSIKTTNLYKYYLYDNNKFSFDTNNITEEDEEDGTWKKTDNGFILTFFASSDYHSPKIITLKLYDENIFEGQIDGTHSSTKIKGTYILNKTDLNEELNKNCILKNEK